MGDGEEEGRGRWGWGGGRGVGEGGEGAGNREEVRIGSYRFVGGALGWSSRDGSPHLLH